MQTGPIKRQSLRLIAGNKQSEIQSEMQGSNRSKAMSVVSTKSIRSPASTKNNFANSKDNVYN